MNFKIRLLNKEDAYQLKQLRKIAMNIASENIDFDVDEEKKPTSFFEDKIKNNIYFGVFLKIDLIGIGNVYISKNINHQHKAFLGSLFVLPEYRGKQIASKIIEARINYIKNLDYIDFIRADVIQPNIVMNNLLKKFKFQEIFLYKDCWKRDKELLDCKMYRLNMEALY